MKAIKKAAKFAAAALTALIILSALSAGYYLIPLRVENPAGNTDYRWEPGGVWIKMTEGISHGRFDANGFNNLEAIADPDVLILGSSHMEAVDVPQSETTASQLSDLLDRRLSVYNMGISGHTLVKICGYLPATLASFEKAPKYVVVETGSVALSEKDAEEIINASFPKTPVSHNGFINMLQKIPFFRLMYYQISKDLSDRFAPGSSPFVSSEPFISRVSDDKTADADTPYEPDPEPYDAVFAYLASLESEYGCEIIIFRHPTEQISPDGTVTFPAEPEATVFADRASSTGIDFVDLTADFEKLYSTERKLPHGFISGRIGEGHLNRFGHRVIAERLFREISAKEDRAG